MGEDTRKWIVEHYRENQRSYNSMVNRNFYSKIASMICRAVKTRGFDPKRIIDIGSGTGISAKVASIEFPHALIETLDPSSDRSMPAGQLKNISKHFYCRLADADIDDEFDLLMSSMSYHWFEIDDKRALNGIATSAGVLAISTPTRRLSEGLQNCQAPGNQMLKEVYNEVMEAEDIRMTPRDWRGVDLLKEEIDGFKILSRDEVEVCESISGDDYGDVLHSRGLTLALFGPKSMLAYKTLKRKASMIKDVEISWPIGIIVAKRD